MPRTLWKYIFLETLRLVVIASCVLVTVIAFAVTVKPLGDGKLSAAQAVSFMLFAVPPMLAYALPFAAGFGTTLAYHRLADDNEISAAKAGGLSHRQILAPALAIGLMLALGVGLLNDQIIPRFLTRMEHMITQDLTQVMVNQLDQGHSATFGNTEIHADRVFNYPLEADSPYERTVRLDGLVAIETEADGTISLEATSSTAWLYIFRAAALPEASRGGFNPDDLIAKIVFDDGAAFVDGQYGDISDYETRAWALPSAFNDDPKYLTGAELRALHDRPEAMSFVESRRLDLARALATAQTIRTLERRASTSRQLVFINALAGRTLFVSTSEITWNGLGHWDIAPMPGQSTVEIEEQAADGTVTRSHAAIARLFPQTPSASTEGFLNPGASTGAVSLRFRLELQDVTVGTSTGDARLDTVTQIPEEVIQGLTIEGDPMPGLAALSSAALLELAVPYQGQDDISHRAQNLTRMIDDLGREVLSKRHERYAMSASCLVMVLTGAVMALKLKDKMPLVIYLWSFFPALITIIMIASGQSTIHKEGVVGVPLLWSGVIGLAAYTLLTLRNLARR
ncbi:MAG: lipopolysaccharide export LptBFGC system permease protein LptF [Phycisphaerales bacterium]|jgi:lipopolysaccharide export LptBFGC system permease protein LptF